MECLESKSRAPPKNKSHTGPKSKSRARAVLADDPEPCLPKQPETCSPEEPVPCHAHTSMFACANGNEIHRVLCVCIPMEPHSCDVP